MEMSRRDLLRLSVAGGAGTALGGLIASEVDLAPIIAQAQQLLPRAVHHARDQKLTWTQIGELLGTTAATAARRYRNKP